MERSELYRCGLEHVWQRQTGKLRPTHFARKIGGCEDLIKRLELHGILEGHDGCVNTIHFNPSGDLLVSGSDDKEIVIWDWAAKKKSLSYYSGHTSNVFQARIMPFSDDRSIVSCAADGQVRHSQILENGTVVTKKLAKHRGQAHKLAIEPGSSRTFFSCAEDGFVRHFDLRENKSNKLLRCTLQGSNKARPDHTVRLNSIVINPRNPNYFSVGGSDEYARVYDIRKVGPDASQRKDQPVDYFAPKHLVGSQGVHITCVAYSQQEELLVSYNDELIYQFEKDQGMVPDSVAKAKEMTVDAGLKSDNDANEDGQPQCYKGHRNMETVKGVSYFGPNSEYVVSGSDCGRIFIWKKRGGKLVAMMKGDNEVVNCLEPHPFSTILATSGIESSVKIWTPTAERLQPLPADAEETMESNRRRREDRQKLRPRVIMHVMRLQRRQAQRDEAQSHVDWYNMQRGPFERADDDDDDVDFMESNSTDADSSDEGVRLGQRECIIT